jgi:hypothetical protein
VVGSGACVEGGGVEGGKKRLPANDIKVICWRYRWVSAHMLCLRLCQCMHQQLCSSIVEWLGMDMLRNTNLYIVCGRRQKAAVAQRHGRHPLAGRYMWPRTVLG